MVTVRERVPLAPRCTLELGGPAEHLAEATSAEEVAEAMRWAGERRLPVHVLGGGSNLVVADGPIPGLVLRMASRGVAVRREESQVLVTVEAGEPWDETVAWTVAEGWAGLECLSGIPGSTGATPIQNVGAYGWEVADLLREVRVLDRLTLTPRTLPVSECRFGYRDSRFRREPDAFVVLAATFALRPGGASEIRYGELAGVLEHPTSPPYPGAVRDAVLDLRRRKSMVLDPGDSNRRSVGSFFLNPVVEASRGHEVAVAAVVAGVAGSAAEVPCHPAPDGRVKLSAAWLVERAGFPKGTRRGAVGVSTNHALALVHHGGGTTAELLALAREIQAGVDRTFGITLAPEPVFWGFGDGDPLAC